MHSVKIIDAFARAASTYDTYADVQLLAAGRLAAYMEANTRDLIEGTILEVGCGTGLFSRKLVEMFRDRTFEITDICPEMIAKCGERLGASQAITLGLRDAAAPAAVQTDRAMIVAAFALQWVEDLASALKTLSSELAPGGKLFFSVPASGSFPEWKSLCTRAGVPFTGNQLPQLADFRSFAAANGLRLSLYEESIKISYRSLHDFMQSLKSLGASTATHSQQLGTAEMRRLLSFAQTVSPNNFDVTYTVLFGNFTRLE